MLLIFFFSMRLLNNAHLRVHIREDEDLEKIKKAFLSFFPFDLEKEKLQLKQTTAAGFEDKKIIILELHITKERQLNHFLKHLLNKLTTKQKEALLSQKEAILDDELHFVIRFEKQNLTENDELVLTEKGDCFHLKLGIAAYPAKRQPALNAIEKIFKEG